MSTQRQIVKDARRGYGVYLDTATIRQLTDAITTVSIAVLTAEHDKKHPDANDVAALHFLHRRRVDTAREDLAGYVEELNNLG